MDTEIIARCDLIVPYDAVPFEAAIIKGYEGVDTDRQCGGIAPGHRFILMRNVGGPLQYR